MSIFRAPLEEQEINWWGLVAIIIFYIVILVVGLFASWKKKAVSQSDSEELMLAGRDIGLFVGCFTMTGMYLRDSDSSDFTSMETLKFKNPLFQHISMYST